MVETAQAHEVRPEQFSIGEALAKIVELDYRKSELEMQLAATTEELNRLKTQAMEWYEQNGIRSMRVKDRTVYLHRQIYAKRLDKAGAIAALESLGLTDYVTYNSNSVSAYIREIAREKGLCNKDGVVTASIEELEAILPDEFKGKIGVSDRFYLNITK